MSLGSFIVRELTPEEREYARYLTEVEARRRTAADVQAELEALRSGLSRFEAEYHARVGSLFVELDRVRLAIDEYARRIAALRASRDANPEQVERDVRDEFAERREEIGREEEEVHGYERLHLRNKARPTLVGIEGDELLRLYRELARRFHPDLARTEEERRRREPVMRKVNDVFRDRDLAALRAVAQEAEQIDAAFEQRSIGERLVWAIREVDRLDAVIAELQAELANLQALDSFVLLRREEAGERVVERLEEDLLRELHGERERLGVLISTYRHFLDART